MDSGITTGVAIYLALRLGEIKDDTLLGKFLGPTAEYIGNGLPYHMDKAVQNISKIIEYALHIFESKPYDDGVINPRILRHIINEGAFCEDEVIRAYFGGILASSRKKNMQDERGLNFITILESVSSYQLRTHYICYTLMKEKYNNNPTELNLTSVESTLESTPSFVESTPIFITYEEFLRTMNIERGDANLILPHIFSGLLRLDLISDYFYTGTNKFKSFYKDDKESGFAVTPSQFGIELYLWANGYPDTPSFRFLDESIKIEKNRIIEMPHGESISFRF